MGGTGHAGAGTGGFVKDGIVFALAVIPVKAGVHVDLW
jgi:hypothetical protein